jgi:hypothetical protein
MTTILVTWEQVAGAEEYEIEVDGTVINNGTGTSYLHTNDFDVIDLCGLTAKMDTLEGGIAGTDITIKQVAPGTIVFTKTGSAQSWQVWSGIVNSITFKAKSNDQSTITYSIQ